MSMFKSLRLVGAIVLGLSVASVQAAPEKYKFDMEGQHAFIQFKIPHLGYSMLLGEFTDFDGSFTFDPEAPENSDVTATIKTESVHSNHGERDKHLRGDDFLSVEKNPTASFKSTKVEVTGKDEAKVYGDFTLNGVTKPITLHMKQLGHGKDPWGGYRRGFEGTAKLTLADFGIDYDLGPQAKVVEIYLSIEGVRQ